jgi:drug/metabolite transporter (DMT)-like permease
MTSVALAVATGLGSAAAYGAATAGQHAVAYRGQADVGGLLELLRDPRWLAAAAGDGIGVVLQIVALDSGPVVLVQPLLVLALPVAVVLRSLFGSPPPTRTDLIACALLVLAVAGFFGLLGEPHRGRIISTATAAMTVGVAAVAGCTSVLLARRRSPVQRAVVFGAVAGCWFGLVGVLIEAVSAVWRLQGVGGFGHGRGLVPLAGVIGLCVAGYLLVQVGFQLGPLEASFPANVVLDPVTAVVLGALLLGEHVPVAGVRLPGYLLCVAVIGWSAVRLAGTSRVQPSASATMTS